MIREAESAVLLSVIVGVVCEWTHSSMLAVLAVMSFMYGRWLFRAKESAAVCLHEHLAHVAYPTALDGEGEVKAFELGTCTGCQQPIWKWQ